MNYLLALLLALFGYGDPPAPGTAAVAGDGAVSIPLAQAGGGPPLPSVTPARGADPPLVVIDPGHGGRDPGASGTTPGWRRRTSRWSWPGRSATTSPPRPRPRRAHPRGRPLHPLPDRYAIARRLDADLFISLHADAAPANDAARGATVYTLSEVASDREAALLAQRENAGRRDRRRALSNDANVNLILIDLAQRESMDVSARFAQLLHREAAPLFAFQEDWHRFAAFVVLKAPTVPSVLFEAGYISNEQDARFLSSDEGRREIATGLRRAIEAHFARRFISEGAGS
jgi:N-acetylmuramoyl-L-alanine amidase